MPDLLCQNQSYSSSLPCFCIYGLSTSVFLGIMFCLPWLTLSVLYFHVFKQRYDVSACDCTQGPYKHCNSVRLKVESERKILCCSGKSTLYQRCTGHITQLGFTPPPKKKKKKLYNKIPGECSDVHVCVWVPQPGKLVSALLCIAGWMSDLIHYSHAVYPGSSHKKQPFWSTKHTFSQKSK